MRSMALWILGILWVSGFCLSQEAERKESEIRYRDLSDMYYADTLLPKPKPAVETSKGKKPSQGGAKQPQTSKVEKIEVAEKTLPQPTRRVGLKYRILLGTNECNLREVDPSHIFSTGDRIRFQFESNVDGYLYVLDKQSSGQERILFPHSEINGGRNEIERGISYSVPATSWFRFQGVPGEERLTVIVSRTPLQSLPQEIPSENVPTVSVAALTNELNQNVRARDLVFFKEKAPVVGHSAPASPSTQATVVINSSDDQNNLVYTEITLRHQ